MNRPSGLLRNDWSVSLSIPAAAGAAKGLEGGEGGEHQRARFGGGAVCHGVPGAARERPAPRVRQGM